MLTRTMLVFFAALLIGWGSSSHAQATFLEKELTVEDIETDFGPYLNTAGRIDRQGMILFLSEAVGITPFDAAQTGYLQWGNGGRSLPGFIPDTRRQVLLEIAGIFELAVADGMTPDEYLAYVHLGFGAGSIPQVKDYLVSLLNNLNYVWNLRTSETHNDQYQNTFYANRESIAYRMVMKYFGKTYQDFGAPQLPEVRLTRAKHLPIMKEIFTSGDHLEAYLVSIGLDPRIARTVKHQWSGYQEDLFGITYRYGIEALLNYRVRSRTNPLKVYRGEPRAVWRTIVGLTPRIDLESELDAKQILTLINVLGSIPPGDPYVTVIDQYAPFVDQSIELTGDDLIEFMVALGNLLPNRPSDSFNDLIPAADIELMKPRGIWDMENPEFEYMVVVIPKIYELVLLGDSF